MCDMKMNVLKQVQMRLKMKTIFPNIENRTAVLRRS